ncbi:MAG: hypothetical protein KAI93_10295, partial [Desulfobacterales bacterium]|nr:hypothetical protein [Desulfobacterales bacterium]
GSLQRVNAAKIDANIQQYFILRPVKKRAHYVVETHGILDFGFRISDLTADITTEHQLSVIPSKI